MLKPFCMCICAYRCGLLWVAVWAAMVPDAMACCGFCSGFLCVAMACYCLVWALLLAVLWTAVLGCCSGLVLCALGCCSAGCCSGLLLWVLIFCCCSGLAGALCSGGCLWAAAWGWCLELQGCCALEGPPWTSPPLPSYGTKNPE